MIRALPLFYFFFFNDTATTEIYTLSLHDALPIFFGVWHSDEHILASNSKCLAQNPIDIGDMLEHLEYQHGVEGAVDRKSTRLNSSHLVISYAVFCLKKKKKQQPVYEVYSDLLRPP